MNNLDRLAEGQVHFKEFAKRYLDYVSSLMESLDLDALHAFLTALQEARSRGGNIFIAGNGGSAATATHMANDLGIGLLKKNESAVPFRVMALTDSNAVMTAIANDDGYENLFINQLKIHYQPSDLLILISASGNSPNLVKAAEWVKAKNGQTAGLLGFDGGRLKDICDVALTVNTPGGEYGPVEDIHLVMDHLIAAWLERATV